MQQLIFGYHPIKEALLAGKEFNKIMVKKGRKLEDDLSFMLHKAAVPVQSVPVEKLNRLTRKNHQGLVGFLSPIEYGSLKTLISMIFERGENPFLILLDGITDTRNLGAIARSAECAGAHGLILSGRGGALPDENSLKASAGALMHLTVCRENNLEWAVRFMKESGLKIVCATEHADLDYRKADLSSPMVLILGSEETGIRPEIRALADVSVKIPIRGKISSLNVSAAAAILIYEAQRNIL